ncbi:MAG: hypothetical protein LBG69_07305 [Zoogloeaceae bacterium]|jgi:lipopolysaccharide biosynthesis glycosyltransferase|nr:hypothetical protein [Zoogloeaceae bacterium]
MDKPLADIKDLTMNLRRQSIPVFFIGSSNCVDQMCVAMASLLDNTESLIDFYIIDCDLTSSDKKAIEGMRSNFQDAWNSIEFIKVDIEKEFSGCSRWKGYLDTWARSLIPNLKPELPRAIYLDSDFLIYGDIKSLYEQNIAPEYALAAVPDIGYIVSKDSWAHAKNLDSRHDYFASGMLLFNCDKYREVGALEKIKEAGRKLKPFFCEQDAMNTVFDKNNYQKLKWRFHLRDINIEPLSDTKEAAYHEIKNEWQHVVCQHLTHRKPWLTMRNDYNNKILQGFSDFWRYAAMTPHVEALKLKLMRNLSFTKIMTIRKKYFLGMIPVRIKITVDGAYSILGIESKFMGDSLLFVAVKKMFFFNNPIWKGVSHG